MGGGGVSHQCTETQKHTHPHTHNPPPPVGRNINTQFFTGLFAKRIATPAPVPCGNTSICHYWYYSTTKKNQSAQSHRQAVFNQ